MLFVAKQHAGFVSEIVYFSSSSIADCKLTYYSSECEVDFCGHGTIAAMYELIKSNKLLLDKKEILFETNKKGILKLYNKIKEEDAVYITSPSPVYYNVSVSSAAVADAFGIDKSVISTEYPLDIIDAGLHTLIVPIQALADEIRIFPDLQTLKKLCIENDIDIVLLFCIETKDSNSFAHTRVFPPKFGYLEDPATGSGNSAFGYYLLKNKLWNGTPICIEQGGIDRIFNSVKLTCDDEKVLFGGKSTLRIEGYYYI